MSTRPYLKAVASYIACTLLGSLTSALKKNASLHSDAVFSPASCPTSATQTFAPSDEKRIAASRPMPPAAPVITATLPSSLPTLEEPRALVVGHDFVEHRLFSLRVVEIVIDHVVAERLPRHLSVLQLCDGFAHRVRKPFDVGLVCVAFELGRQLELLLDAMEARRQQGGEGEIWVGVRAGDSRLASQVLPVADDPEAAGAVVMAPGQRRRCPAARGVTLVRVDVGREKDRELGCVRDVAGKVLLEGLRLSVEHVPAALPEARMDVARAADPAVVGLGHEGDGATVLVRDLLDAVLVDHMVVRNRQRVREAEVDLLLPRPGLPLRALHLDPRGLHALAYGADEGLVVGRSQDVVVEDVGDRWGEVDVVLRVRFGERFFEQVELELRPEHGLEAQLAGALDLRAQNLPG